MQNNSAASVRKLVDTYFSLQWCRENVVIPLTTEPSLPPENQKITIAVANISYLGTIGNWIKDRVKVKGYSCIFIELPQEEIENLLDEASIERKFRRLDLTVMNDLSENIDTNNINKDKYYEVAVALNKTKIDHWVNIREISNKEQLQQLDSIWLNMKKRIESPSQ